MSIDVLTDVALLEIFDFCLDDRGVMSPFSDLFTFTEGQLTAWCVLVRVCRKWRNIIFGSPLRLNLQVYCRPHRRTVKEKMVAWTALPIIVAGDCDYILDNKMWVDNIVAVFEHRDRISRLTLDNIRSWQLELVLAEMQQPFPALKHLYLRPKYVEPAPVVPDSFLGGSAPQLQSLILASILFPGLPKLLLSATQLVHLQLWNTPHSGYISPEKMVACLSVLTSLEGFYIGFKSPQSRPGRNSQRLPPPTRTFLPALNRLEFKGVSEYLKNLVARIDAPLLYSLDITFFHQLIFDTPQLTQFISRCAPKFKTPDEAFLDFNDCFGTPKVGLHKLHSPGPVFEQLTFGVSCNHSDWRLSFMTQMCSSSFPQGLISTVETLFIKESNGVLEPPWQDDIEVGQWLELLQPFTAVKTLYVSKEFTPRIAPALQELVGEEVLPALQTLFLRELSLSGPVQDAMDQFVAARWVSGRPVQVVVSR